MTTLKISKGHASSVRLGGYISKMADYCLTLYNSKYVQLKIIKWTKHLKIYIYIYIEFFV